MEGKQVLKSTSIGENNTHLEPEWPSFNSGSPWLISFGHLSNW